MFKYKTFLDGDLLVEIGKKLVERKSTVRAMAKEYNISKSNIHKKLTEFLPEIDLKLAYQVREIFDYNWNIKHFRGGAATSRRYKEIALQQKEKS